MGKEDAKPSEQLLLAEMQVLLAQLRTQLSILRAGMGLFGGALTIYFLLDSNHWAVPGLETFPQEIKGALLIVALLGLWRFLSAERKIILVHRLIKQAEGASKRIDEIMV